MTTDIGRIAAKGGKLKLATKVTEGQLVKAAGMKHFRTMFLFVITHSAVMLAIVAIALFIFTNEDRIFSAFPMFYSGRTVDSNERLITTLVLTAPIGIVMALVVTKVLGYVKVKLGNPAWWPELPED